MRNLWVTSSENGRNRALMRREKDDVPVVSRTEAFEAGYRIVGVGEREPMADTMTKSSNLW